MKSVCAPPVFRRTAVGYMLAATVLAPAVLSAGPARAADVLAGTYTVQGWDPNETRTTDKPYRGVASLKKQGEVFVYEGDMDGYRYAGVGIYHPGTKTLALHFKEVRTGKVGVAHFRVAGGRLDGTWAWMGDPTGKMGKEIWVRK